MALLLLAWLVLFAFLLLLILQDRRRCGALTLSYFLSLSLIHVPGALVYLHPSAGYAETLRGMQLTVLGLAMFVAGVAFAQLHRYRAHAVQPDLAPLDAGWMSAIARKFSAIGIFVFFIAVPLAAEVPSSTAVLSPLVGLIVIGIWLWLCAAIVRGDRRKQVLILALLPLLPLSTLATIGFVSFSTQWVITVLAFFFVMSRRRLWMIVLMPFAFYLALSVFVAYLGERNSIRDLIWYEEADLSARMERIGDIFTHFELLDLDNPKHAEALDARLNQNALVGAAAFNLDGGSVDFAYGATVPWWAVIPRAIWPEKPEIGGGRSIVSDFTGLYFPEGTSVGAGQVLEFYVNFGTIGVVIGFFVWGFALITFDRRIMHAMAKADMPLLLRYSMVGLTLVNPGGNLLEIIIAAIGAYISSPMILYVDRKLRSLPLARFVPGFPSGRGTRAP